MTTVVEEGGGLIGCCCEQNKTDPSGGQGRGGSAGWWVDEQYPRNHRGRYLIMRRITLIKISCHALSVCGSAANWMTDRLCCTMSHHGRRRVASAAAWQRQWAGTWSILVAIYCDNLCVFVFLLLFLAWSNNNHKLPASR